jgi:hypothetical protein
MALISVCSLRIPKLFRRPLFLQESGWWKEGRRIARMSFDRLIRSVEVFQADSFFLLSSAVSSLEVRGI